MRRRNKGSARLAIIAGTMLRLCLLCEESAGARLLQAVAAGGHRIAALLTSPGSAPWRLAEKLGCAPIAARRVREPGFAAELARAGVELLLNVHSLHRIRDFVRACDYRPYASPWGAPRAQLAGREVEVLEVAVTGEPSQAPPGTVRRQNDETSVAAADE